MNLRTLVKKTGAFYTRMNNKKEYETQVFGSVNERPIEYRFVFEVLSKLFPTSVLDVGTGVTSLPSLMRSCGFLVTAIDNIKDYWPDGMYNKHYHILNDDITHPQISKKFDVVTCISVLEHIQDFNIAVSSMSKLLNPNGSLVITFPYNENKHCPNVYELADSNAKGKKMVFKTKAFSRTNLNQWCEANNLEIVKQEFWDCFSGEFWSCGERKRPFVEVEKNNLHHISCVWFKKK